MTIIDRFKEVVNRNQVNTVIELGACQGAMTRYLLDILQDSHKPFKFHVFEANVDFLPGLVNKLRYYLSSFPDVKLYMEAVGRLSGKIVFYKSLGKQLESGQIVGDYDFVSSIRKPRLATLVYPGLKFIETNVECVTLDWHMDTRSGICDDEKVHFIWCDINGSEGEFMLGATKTLKRTKYLYVKDAGVDLYEGYMRRAKLMANFPYFQLIENYSDGYFLNNTLF